MAMFYCGVDLHAKSSNFCLVNRRGKRMAEGLVPSSRRGFTTLMASGKGEEIRVVLEASTRSRWPSWPWPAECSDGPSPYGEMAGPSTHGWRPPPESPAEGDFWRESRGSSMRQGCVRDVETRRS